MNRYSIFCTLLTFIVLFFPNKIQSKEKLPTDILDSNIGLAIYEHHPHFDFDELVEFCEEAFIDMGFNLVHTGGISNKIEKQEYEIESKNKNIKYFIIVEYKEAFFPKYYISLTKNSGAINLDLLKKSYISESSKLFVEKPIRKFKDHITKFKKKNPNTDYIEYDTSLLIQSSLTDLDKEGIVKTSEFNTILDENMTVEYYEKLPEDLLQNSLAIIKVRKDEVKGANYINTNFTTILKKYPSNYQIFNTYEDYLQDGGNKKFKYRIVLGKIHKTFYSEKREDLLSTVHKSKPTKVIGETKAWDKVLFNIIIKSNETNEYFIGSKEDFIGRAIKDFVVNAQNHL